jgi:hypothetical protein
LLAGICGIIYAELDMIPGRVREAKREAEELEAIRREYQKWEQIKGKL